MTQQRAEYHAGSESKCAECGFPIRWARDHWYHVDENPIRPDGKKCEHPRPRRHHIPRKQLEPKTPPTPKTPAPSVAYTALKRAAEAWCKEHYDNIRPANTISVHIDEVDAYKGVLWADVVCLVEGDREPIHISIEARFTVTDARATDDQA